MTEGQSQGGERMGYDDATPILRCKRTQRARVHAQASLICMLLVIPLTTVFVLLFHWQWALGTTRTESANPARPIPTTIAGKDIKILLNPEDHVYREASTRYFSWNISQAKLAPDGVEKDIFLINGAFPGPTIEARPGDVLEIEVLNVSDEGLTLHWHGLHMKGANHMDGAAGITQCIIKPGGNFTYRIPIDEQIGTFWYHAHSEVQRADGLYGGLIIHDPDANTYYYDAEILLLVGDWYHWPAKKVLATFMSRTSTGQEPNPDSLLLNGIGYFECSMATPGAPVNCSGAEKPHLILDKSRRYRIRLVNVGSLTGYSLTIPDSQITVFQLDGGQEVTSSTASSVGILYPAERVDFLISWSPSDQNTESNLIVALDEEYFLRPNFALTPVQSFPIFQESTAKPAQPMRNITETKFNLQEAIGATLDSPLPVAQEKLMIYTSIEILNRLKQIPKGFINRTTWEPQSLPLLALHREKWNDHQLVPWSGPEPVWVELTINNIDANGHPFHLHGFNFYVIASYEGNGGWDYYNPFTPARLPRGGPFNYANPLRKDTVYVPRWGYVVIQFLADNEGIWALHCHLLWHQASGMSMAIQVLGDEHNGLSDSTFGISAAHSCAV